MKRFFKKALSLMLCGAMLLGSGLELSIPVSAAGVDIGTNPTPKIDIAVNVPTDYPGTFLDFKQELTQKLVDEGMDPSTFRITNTAVSIDTTSMNGWYVYDHYRNDSTYNTLVPADQRTIQPKRITSDSNVSGSYNISDVVNRVTNKFTIGACANLDRHIYIYQSDTGASNMAFAGYGTNAYSDWMVYPAASSSTRTFSFNVDASVINTHTLTGFGFFMNTGIIDGKVYGYLLYFTAGSAAGGTATGTIKKINGIAADSLTTAFTGCPDVGGSSISVPMGAQKKVRLTVELKKDAVTIQTQAYDAAGNLGTLATNLRDFAIPQFHPTETVNGLGPWVGYSSHNCTGFSSIIYTDLEMTYEASAFDALKYVQYYENAEYKYFVNLAGDSGNSGIPNEISPDYADGINRMNENEIFYLSNAQDGKVVTDSVYQTDEDGNLVLDVLGNPILATNPDGTVQHQGLGATNGLIAMTDDYVGQMAAFIAKNYTEGNHFKKANVSSELPLANFYVVDKGTDDQLMTVHLQHLVNSGETVIVNIADKSQIGTISGAEGKIAGYRYKVYDPKGNIVVNPGWVDSLDKIPNYSFTASSESGTYVFELTVRDQAGNESHTSQTYVVAYLDDEEPFIEGANTGRNVATITLTDTGEGIDEDGITFIQDGRGSGVAAYWVTNDNNATPTEDDWTTIGTPQHEYSFDIEIDSKDPIIVWVKDECGNVGNKAVFQPTLVRVEDQDGNPIDEYYVIGDNPIVVLPDDDVVPPSGDDDEYHSGWETPDKTPITPGTQPVIPPSDDHEIIVRPTYSKDQAILVYLPNGGTIDGKNQAQYTVIGGVSILKKIGDQNVEPVRTGYTFTGWKLLDSHNTADAYNPDYISNQSHLAEIKEQVATASANAGTNYVDTDYYYLVAQWQISTYTLRFDANGGSLGNLRSYSNIPFEQNLAAADISNDAGTQAVPSTGRGVPTKEGYIFQGWSTDRRNNLENIFVKAATADAGIQVVTGVTMPASDTTVYAVWKEDPNKFIVSFDSDGGSTIKDVAYAKTTPGNYKEAVEPSKPGYTFQGWYLVDEDGNMTETGYAANTAIQNKENHTFRALWQAESNTKYNVDYYYNSGTKDSNGNYIYRKAAGLTKTYTGTTEAQATVQAADKLSTITVDGTEYWYNAGHANNVFTDVITGSPVMSLKLYYDRYFDVTATHKGEGTVTGASKVKEGETPTVTWAAAEGSYVTKVVVDGAIRDDLLNETSYTYPAGLHENHKIYVEFTSEEEEPQKPVKPNPPETPVDKYYDIRTSVVGCTDPSKYEITPTTSVKGGEDHTVAWSIKDSNYQIVKIEVDGVAQEITNNSSVDFSGVATNHTVVITVSAVPTIGGSTTEGHYTVTVNRYGGDDKVEISNTMVVNKGDKAPVSWDTTNSEYKIYKIMIDGEEISLTERQLEQFNGYARKPLNNVQANHVVDIYMAKPDEEGKIDPPDLTEEKYVQLTTQLIGAPGSITGGAVIEQGSDYKVDWDVVTGTDTNPDSDTYVYYEIEKIVVNDEVKTDETGAPVTEISELEMKDISEDTDVKVYVKPVMHRVTILKYGEGTVSPSKSVYHLANYKDIEATPETGWSTVKIVVDNVTTYELELPEPAPTPEPDPTPVTRQNAPQAPVAEESATVENSASEESSAAESSEPAGEESSEESEESSVAEETPVVEDQQADESSELRTASRMARALGIVRRDAEDAGITPRAADPSIDNLEGIVVDHVIEVYFTKNDEEGNPTPLPDDVKLNKVNVTIEGGAGTVTNGPAIVEDNGETSISWTIGDPEHYEVEKITVNGVEQPTTDPLTIENITEDQNVVITLKKKPVPNNEVVTPPTLRETLHTVSAVIKGDGGSIVGGGQVADGGSREVSWTKGDDSEVKYVFVNGELRDDLKEASSVLLENIGADQTVVVVIGKPGVPPVNVDKDDDGKPDINIDKDDDGDPDVNIDKDGDGEPDINIDTDDDGEPDINIDTDDDGEPDINIDTDGDGEPDINIDTDDDGEPDINIDTDDDGEPDINIDKDGDGKPDINIDKDKDGKPDVNIDKDGDGEPDINIDTDGDGEPDINIDTDGDGEPEVNIDHDGDGKPDINIDTDGDGKPDINIDTNGDGKPDINIDTNGDGKADINIDINGDGIPDLNIDTDGDGKPDKNIDADGDGKIDNVGPATGDEGMRPMMAVLLGAVLAMAVLLLIKRRFAR